MSCLVIIILSVGCANFTSSSTWRAKTNYEVIREASNHTLGDVALFFCSRHYIQYHVIVFALHAC
jgi:hypothetical protein